MNNFQSNPRSLQGPWGRLIFFSPNCRNSTSLITLQHFFLKGLKDLKVTSELLATFFGPPSVISLDLYGNPIVLYGLQLKILYLPVHYNLRKVEMVGQCAKRHFCFKNKANSKAASPISTVLLFAQR